MAQYIHKPIVVDAVQYTGKNIEECLAFCPDLNLISDSTDMFLRTSMDLKHLCPNNWILAIPNGDESSYRIMYNEEFRSTYDQLDQTRDA